MYLVLTARAILPVLLACLWLAGCSKLVTVELTPKVLAQDCTSDHDSNDTTCLTPCPLVSMGTGCNGPNGGAVPANSLKELSAPADAMVVGWGDGYDAGTQPCACWEWVSTFSRGYARFDFSTLVGPVDKITYASLSWKTRRVEGGSPNACLMKLHRATGSWKRGATPSILLYDDLDKTTVAGGFVGLAAPVQDWWSSPESNFGLLFTPVRAKTVAESNAACLDEIRDLRLVVKYRRKKMEWPSGP